MVPQTRQLIGIAQIGSLDDLVELRRVGMVLLAVRLVVQSTRRQPRTLGAAGLVLVSRAHLHFGLRLVCRGLRGIVLIGSVLALLAGLAVALGLARVGVLIAGLVRFALGVVLVLALVLVVLVQI